MTKYRCALIIVTNGTKKEFNVTQLRNMRKRRLWTQAKLSEESGVPRVNITRYENGTRAPKAVDALKLARALGVTVEELLGVDTVETPEGGRL